MIGKSITQPGGEVNVNQAFCEMLGYSAEELQNKKWRELSHPDDIEMTQKIIVSLLSGERASARFIKDTCTKMAPRFGPMSAPLYAATRTASHFISSHQ